MVTPPSISRSRMRRRWITATAASCLRSLTPSASLDPGACPGEDRHHVGQVVLTLVVVGANLGQRRPQALGVEAVHRRADLGDLLLVVGGVPLLHDAGHAPPLAEHPAIAEGVVD